MADLVRHSERSDRQDWYGCDPLGSASGPQVRVVAADQSASVGRRGRPSAPAVRSQGWPTTAPATRAGRRLTHRRFPREDAAMTNSAERPDRLRVWLEYLSASVRARRERAASRAALLKPISTWTVVLSVITVAAVTWPWLEVRLAAQDILHRHLQVHDDSGVSVTHWPSMLLNLTGATLVNYREGFTRQFLTSAGRAVTTNATASGGRLNAESTLCRCVWTHQTVRVGRRRRHGPRRLRWGRRPGGGAGRAARRHPVPQRH